MDYLYKNLQYMNTIATKIPTHRKLIDIPEDVFHTLTVKAAAMGTSLKKLIEEILIREAEDMDDAEVYKYLVATRPDGKVMLNEQEQEEFENWLELHRK